MISMPEHGPVERIPPVRELIRTGSWVWDLAGNTATWSDELYRLLDVPVGSLDVHPHTYFSFLECADRRRLEQMARDAFAAGRSFRTEVRLRTDPVTDVHHHVIGTTIPDDQATRSRLLLTCVDISDRVRRRCSAPAVNEMLRGMFDRLGVGVAFADFEGRLTRVNQAFAEYLGYSALELQRMTFVEVTHPADIGVTMEMVRANADRPQAFTYEKRYIRKDGRVVWGRATVTALQNTDGTLNGYLAVVEDINDMKLSADALRRQSELLGRILDHLPLLVSLHEPNGRPIFVNREFERVSGWTLAEARTVDLFEVGYPDPDSRRRMREAFEAADSHFHDCRPVTRDGRTIEAQWACIRLSDGSILAIGQDVTAAREMQLELLQAQKMEALGKLAGGVAHDFNNILTVISGSAAFLKMRLENDREALEDVDQVLQASDRASFLTRQLLTFSRRQVLNPQVIDVNESIQAMAKTLRRIIGEHVELAITPMATEPTIRIDIQQFEQVLLNLVVNARDAMPSGGVITISTADGPTLPSGRRQVVIGVADDGVGISPDIIPRIFDPFFTTKPIGKGTGLGLATVRGIVEQAGGSIGVESGPGDGTTFRMSLPLTELAATSASTKPLQAEARGQGTILLVEDEASLRRVASRILQSLGYTVIEARHGADGIRLAAQQPRIDLVVTDVVMPEVNGRELAVTLRRQRPTLPVLYISGYTDEELLRDGVLEAHTRLLRKPFLPADLARAVREMLEPVTTPAP